MLDNEPMKRLLVIAVFVLFAAACSAETAVDLGASSDTAAAPAQDAQENQDSQDTGEAPTAEVAEAESAEPTAPSAPTVAPAPTVDTGSAAAQLGADDWCTAAAQIEESFDELDLVDFSDPVALEAVYVRSAALLDQIQAIAPPAIAADVAVTREGFLIITGALREAEWDFLNVDLSVIDELDQQQEIAGYNIEKYNFDVCGLGEDPGDAPILDDSFGDSVEGSEATESEELLSGTIGEQAIANLVASGFTEAEATCILDGVDIFNPEALANFENMLQVFDECGISIDRLSQIGG